MLKILKRGKVPKSKRIIYKKTCEFCGCEFEFDDKRLYRFNRKTGNLNNKYIKCPTCHANLLVKRDDIDRME